MTEPRTEAGRWLVAAQPELANLTTGHVVKEANDYAVPAIEAEAREQALTEVETAVKGRMHGGIWLSENLVLDIVKTVREAAPTDD